MVLRVSCPRREMIPKETFRLNDRVKAVVKAIQWDKKAPSILLSRTAPEMVSNLFSIEVPEIGQGSIEIRAVARDPGSRAKIAVLAKDSRLEPKGACIGMRGARGELSYGTARRRAYRCYSLG